MGFCVLKCFHHQMWCELCAVCNDVQQLSNFALSSVQLWKLRFGVGVGAAAMIAPVFGWSSSAAVTLQAQAGNWTFPLNSDLHIFIHWPPVDNVQCDAVRRHRGDTGECSNPVRTGLVSFSVTEIVRDWLNLVLVFFHPLCSAQLLNTQLHILWVQWASRKAAMACFAFGRKGSLRKFGWICLSFSKGNFRSKKLSAEYFFGVFLGKNVDADGRKNSNLWHQNGLNCRCFIFCF